MYYVLKAMYRSGFIKDLEADISSIAAACCRHEKTIRARIELLKARGIVEVKVKNKAVTVTLLSGKKLHELIGATQRLKFHYRRVTCPPEYIIRTIEAAENYRAQEIKIARKHEAYNKALIARRGWGVQQDAAEAIKDQFARMCAFFVSSDTPGLVTSNIEEVVCGTGTLFAYNPDVSFSQESYASRLKLKSKRSGHYWQQRLQKFGLLKVEPRRLEAKKECGNRATILGKRFWNSKDGKAFLVMRNKLHFETNGNTTPAPAR